MTAPTFKHAPNDRHYNNAVLKLRKMVEEDGTDLEDALRETIYFSRTGITPAQGLRLRSEATAKYGEKAA